MMHVYDMYRHVYSYVYMDTCTCMYICHLCVCFNCRCTSLKASVLNMWVYP